MSRQTWDRGRRPIGGPGRPEEGRQGVLGNLGRGRPAGFWQGS